MLRIKKRDGNIEEFDITKIENAIEKAFMAEHKFYNHDIIEMLALRVTSDFNRKVVNDTIGIEDVQDSVEIVLIQAGCQRHAPASGAGSRVRRDRVPRRARRREPWYDESQGQFKCQRQHSFVCRDLQNG